MNATRWLAISGLSLGAGLFMSPGLALYRAQAPPPAEQRPATVPRAKVMNPHGPIAIPCQNCHTYTAWRPIRSMPEFSHDQTRYPLRGMHKDVACSKCHTSRVFKNVSTRCAVCHADIHRRQFGANCENCHSVKGWKVSVREIQNHQNRFPLVGAHAMLDCGSCHKGAATGQFTGLSTACYSCHQKEFKNPNFDHVAVGFPTTCESCHTMDTWFGAKFDHLKYTGYALTGMHARLECTACHINGQFKGTPAACYACHQTDYTRTNNPSHAQASLPHDCGTCHTTANWLNAKFDHLAYAGYALTGKHANVPCAQCHANGYRNTPTGCVSCHQKEFDRTINPNHKAQGFPTGCEMCHTTAGWIPSSFDHSKSGFPLTGAHVQTLCSKCHVNNNYTTLPKDCYGCHKANYTGTSNPNHVAAGFPTGCTMCHSTVSWSGATFDHSKTGFPLTGAHKNTPCMKCHVNGVFAGTPKGCYSCHKGDFNGTKEPNHLQAALPHDCSICHSTVNWLNARFDHLAYTGYALTGKHAALACKQCHLNGQYAGTPSACASCHQSDYNKTTDPNHKLAGFPTDCSICHTTAGWSPSSFDHSKSGFPLTGAHKTTPCMKCHVNNNYTTVPKDCYSCHKANYDATNDPNHKAAGFPTTCQICHNTGSWSGATFDHSKTAFPLTGAHKTTPCVKCHVNNVFAGTPKDCFSCHKSDYNGTTDPNHKTAGFPTTCQTCHSTTSWAGATFNHTWFSMRHGGANGVCKTCHTNSANYAVFTCTNCHAKAKTDNQHSGVSGYVYNSVNCYLCHRNPGGGG